MGIEIADHCVLEADAMGRPARPTNMRDVEVDAALTPPVRFVACPAGYAHGAPINPIYDTTTKETDDE